MAENDEKLVTFLQNRFAEAHKFADPYMELAQDYYKLYRSYKDSSGQPWKNNIFVPFTFTLCETYAARYISTVHGRSPVLNVVPLPGGNADLADEIQTIVNYYLENPEYEFVLEELETIKNKAIYGNGTMLISPSLDNSTGLWEFEGPLYEDQSIYQIYPDPHCKRLTRARFVYSRRERYWEEIKDFMDAGVFEEFSKEQLKENYGNLWENRHRQVLSAIGKTTADDVTYSADRWEELNYYEDGRIVTMLGRSTIVRDTDKKGSGVGLPYKHPFVEGKFVIHPNEYYGSGIPEIVKDMQEELNLIRNQRRDNVDLVINKMWKRNMFSNIDAEQLISAPGGIVDVANMDDLNPLEFTDVTTSAYQEEGVIKGDIESATGEWTTHRGGPADRRETATTNIQREQTAQVRTSLPIRITEITMFRELCKRILALVKTYMTEDEIRRITGRDHSQIARVPLKELMRCYDFQFTASAMNNLRDLRSRELSEAIKLLTSLPPELTARNVTPFMTDIYPVLKEALETLNFRNVDQTILKKINQMQPQPGERAVPMPAPQTGVPEVGAAPMSMRGIPPELQQLGGPA